MSDARTSEVSMRQRMTWTDFEARLAASLATLPRPAYLVVEVAPARDPHGSWFVQFARHRGGLLAETVSNLYLPEGPRLVPAQEAALAAMGWEAPRPRSKHYRNWRREWPSDPAPFAVAAAMAVRTLREVQGAGAPADLKYRRFGRRGPELPDPMLGIEPAPARAFGDPAGRFDGTVEAALLALNGVGEVLRPEPGHWTLRIGAASLRLVRLDVSPPILRVYTSFLTNIAPTPALFEDLNRVNLGMLVGRVLWVEGDLIAAVELGAADVCATSVDGACVQVAATADQLASELRAHVGPAPWTAIARALVN